MPFYNKKLEGIVFELIKYMTFFCAFLMEERVFYGVTFLTRQEWFKITCRKRHTMRCLLIYIFMLGLVQVSFPVEDTTSSYFFISERHGLREPVITDIIAMANIARDRVTSKIKRHFMGHTEIVLCITPEDFQRKTHFSSEHILASADYQTLTIHINLSLLSQHSQKTFLDTLIHEYAHLYLGNKCSPRLPRWFEEGLAMHLAGEWDFNDAFNLALARVAGRYIPLGELEVSFPDDPRMMRLAYLQSYSIVSYILKKRYDGGNVGLLIDDLTNPEGGADLIALYWSNLFRDGLEISWRRSTKTLIRNWFLILSSNAVFWFGITVLFIVAYIRKRHRQQPVLESWREEGPYYSSPHDQNISSDVDFYTEHEDPDDDEED